MLIGMLLMVAIIFLIVIIVGLVKVYKLLADVKDLRILVDEMHSQVLNQFDERERRIDELIENSIKESNSYTDKRIDKLNK